MSFFAKNSGRRQFTLLCILLIALAAAQSILSLTCFDRTLGLYDRSISSDLLLIGYLAVALLIVGGTVVLPLLSMKKSAPGCLGRTLTPAPSRAVDFFALLSAAALASTLVTQLILYTADDPLSILLNNPADSNQMAYTMLMASLVLALPAALFFIGLFAGKKWLYTPLLTLVWVCVYMLRVYFDNTVLLMSPVRQMTLVSLAAIALFLIAELRLLRTTASPIFYGITAALAALFAGINGVSTLLMTFVGLLPVNTETAYYVFQLAIALFALMRMKAVLKPIFAAYDKTSKAEPKEETV